jgi:hypothetical protein
MLVTGGAANLFEYDEDFSGWIREDGPEAGTYWYYYGKTLDVKEVTSSPFAAIEQVEDVGSPAVTIYAEAIQSENLVDGEGKAVTDAIGAFKL